MTDKSDQAPRVPAQRLLMPVTMQLAPRDSDWVAQNLDTLQKMGIGIESFGPATWKIDAIPQFLKGSDPAPLFREIIDELRQTSAATSRHCERAKRRASMGRRCRSQSARVDSDR